MIVISNPNLFDFLLEFHFEDKHIDLHGEYNCTGFNYDDEKKELMFSFFKYETDKKNPDEVNLTFVEADLLTINFPVNEIIHSFTFDNFHRGIYNNIDSNYNGKMYFYIETIEGGIFKILAKEVILSWEEKKTTQTNPPLV